MTAPRFEGISHLDLSVSDIGRSTEWYRQVLGLREVKRAEFADRTMVVFVVPDGGLIIGLNQHVGCPPEHFDERRVGLDHVGFAVSDRADLDRWQAHLEAQGVEHSPIADGPVGSALVFRDPDNIQLEIWWTKSASALTPGEES